MVVSAGIKYPNSCLTGANVAPEIDGKKGAPIDLAGYEGNTVTIIVVAKTNWGDEIELVKFTGVTVPNS